ncbi:hypothetical protein TNCV_3280611 [Trichonephila clavipes]|nr:hypothetical protein TNCV_3280611 [Trichonephila clavipes]
MKSQHHPMHLFAEQIKIEASHLQKTLTYTMSYPTGSQLQKRLPYADSITPFISSRAPLIYREVLSPYVTPTTDGREETNGWISPVNLNLGGNSRCKKELLPPEVSGEHSVYNTRKWMLCLPPFSPTTYSVLLKYSIV